MNILNRREFLFFSLTVAGAAAFPLTLQATGANSINNQTAIGWLEITPDNTLSIRLTRHEMGQQIRQGIISIVAEALNTHPNFFECTTVAVNDLPRPFYGFSSTGGSSSISSQWDTLREQAARARALLNLAAHKTFAEKGLSVSNINLEDGRYINNDNDSLSFADVLPMLVSIDTLPEAESPSTNKPFRFVGNNVTANKYLVEIVTGKKHFGIDRPITNNMLIATLVRLPNSTAKWVSDRRADVIAIKGVTDVVDTPMGIAIVGTNTWAVLNAQKSLQATAQSETRLSTASLENDFNALLSDKSRRQSVTKKGANDNLTEGLTTRYFLPGISQTPIEPLSCTVEYFGDRCVIFAGSQNPRAVIEDASRITGLPETQIEFHDEYSGGSFGRRLSNDFIVETIKLAKQLNQSVKLIWSREDMFSGDFHRPAAAIELIGYKDANDQLAGIKHNIVSNGKLWYSFPSAYDEDLIGTAKHYVKSALQWWQTETYADGITSSEIIGDSADDGIKDLPYNFHYLDVGHVPVTTPKPNGFFRSVGNALNIFALESFLDEWASGNGIDPVALRKQLIRNPRLLATLDRCIQLADWNSRSKERPLGIACFANYGSFATTIVELAADSRTLKPSALFCVVDCGIVVAPSQAKAQIEGGLLMALSTAMYEKLGIADGAVTSRNFDRYRILTMRDTPKLHVEFLSSSLQPGGLGELAVPGVAPALANAWRLLTGESLTRLPFLPIT